MKAHFQELMFVFLLAFFLPLNAQTPTVTRMGVGGPPEKRVNVVFVAEAYTREQQSLYQFIAAKAIQETYLTEPFATYARFFNFYSVWTPSNESGISDDDNQVDNFWGAHLHGSCTFLSRQDDLKAFLNQNIPEWTIAVVFYRDDAARGIHTCAGRITMTPDRHVDQTAFIVREQISVVLHEYGHTLANLSDEHEIQYGGGANKKRALHRETAANNRYPDVHVSNIYYTFSSREKLPWNAWIEPDTPVPTPDSSHYYPLVGAFEATLAAAGFFRPMRQCRMRNLYKPFCKVCNEGMILSFYQHSGPVDSFVPPPGDIAFSSETAIEAKLLMPSTNPFITWKLDGALVEGEHGATLELAGLSMTEGSHTVECIVHDTTSRVRIYADHDILKSKGSWRFDVNASEMSRPRQAHALRRQVMGNAPAYFLSNGRFVRTAAMTNNASGRKAPAGIYIVRQQSGTIKLEARY